MMRHILRQGVGLVGFSLVCAVTLVEEARSQPEPVEIQAARWKAQNLPRAARGEEVDRVTGHSVLQRLQAVSGRRSAERLSAGVSRLLEQPRRPDELRQVRQDAHDGITAYLQEERRSGRGTRALNDEVREIRRSLSDTYFELPAEASRVDTRASLRIPRVVRTFYVFLQTPGPAESAYSERLSIDTSNFVTIDDHTSVATKQSVSPPSMKSS
jgi:hypothetical protein